VAEAVDPDLAVVEDPDRRALQAAERRGRAGGGGRAFGGRVEHLDRHRSSCGPQARQTPIPAVTARARFPSQGGTTEANPPAEPPAATTSRSPGVSRAETSSPGPPGSTSARLPHP